MADVKRRQYDASGRHERGRANQRAILDAAIELLVEHHYAETTVALVARGAGVAAPTVYKAFGNKPTLVKAAFDYAAAGDDGVTPIYERERAKQILAEPSPIRKLEIHTEGLSGTSTQSARLQLVV